MTVQTPPALSRFEREKFYRKRLKSELPLYSEKCLKILTKSGGEPVLFVFNYAQNYVHEQVEKQKRETGKVRAIVLKARQTGISTYTAARFFHRATHTRGIFCFILSHKSSSADKLFRIYKLFYEQLQPQMQPRKKYDNGKQLYFDRLLTWIKIATAGSDEVGRSETIQLFHGSEVAFWPNSSLHMASLGQAITDEAGSEIILESTANGMDPVFYQIWNNAVAGSSSYIPLFVPWHADKGYVAAPPVGFALDEEELDLQARFKLTLPQLAWRRMKIADNFKGNVTLFKQEYPASADEAFQLSGKDIYFPVVAVQKAAKHDIKPYGPLVIGVDPAVTADGDRTGICFRSGFSCWKVEYLRKDEEEIAGILRNYIDYYKPRFVNIDAIGVGLAVITLLRSWGYENVVRAIKSSNKPRNPEYFFNKRAEMAYDAKAWLQEDVSIPADGETGTAFIADLLTLSYRWEANKLKIESKDDYKRRCPGMPSPDGWDAFCLTFAEPVLIDKPKDTYVQDRMKELLRKKSNKTHFMAR